MKTVLSAFLVLCLLAGCGPVPSSPSITEPSPSPVCAPGNAVLYLPDENFTRLILTHTSLSTPTPQDLLDALVKAGAQPECVTVAEFELREDNSGYLKLSEEFKSALCSTGTTGEHFLINTVSYSFLDTFRLDRLTLTCEGAPFETGHALFDSFTTEIGLMYFDTSKDAYLHHLSSGQLTCNETNYIESWEEEKIAFWAEELERTGQDFAQNYYAILDPDPTCVEFPLASDPVIRLNLSPRHWVSATPEELSVYLETCEVPPLFQMELNQNGEVSHLIEYDLDATD